MLWTLNTDDTGIAWLTFDAPGKVNTFTSAAMSQLDTILADAALDDRIRALVIVSGKPDSFIAGADIDEIETVESPERARSLVEFGQSVFQRLADMPMLTIAAIHGACLGGGLEMALACDYRVATDDPKTRIGLPEVNLGIIPGWGGTTRLPRLVGLAGALELVLAGKPASTRKARRVGLIDGVVAHAFMCDQVVSFVDSIATDAGRAEVHARRRRARARLMRLLEATPPGRFVMFSRAARAVRKRTQGHYPAPLEAIGVMRRTYGKPVAEGLRAEADAVSRLICSPESRGLVHLYKVTQALKRAPTAAPTPDVRNAVVVGAGAMGGGIAWALANAGIQVRMKDLNWKALEAGSKAAASMFRARVKRRRMTEGEMNLAMHRISCTTDYSGFAHADAVIEAVVEDLDIKKGVLRELERHVPRHALICTNTSSLSLKEMGKALKRPDRFVGLHFFNPVDRMPLVEVVPGPKTSDEAVALAVQLVLKMGKTPVVVGACAGFLVNRILMPYLTESARMFEEGVAADRIDAVLTRFGMPMGPMRLADEVGLDVGVKVARVLGEAYGQRMSVPAVLGEIAGTQQLGRKTGRGFYIHDNGHTRPNPEAEHLPSRRGFADLSESDIVDRAVLVMVNEAARCLEEGVADGPDAIDAAMVLGTGFAPFRGGLMRYAESRGLGAVAGRLNDLADQYGDRFRPARLLEQAADNGGDFSHVG